jgi:hypothetical protein
MSLEWRAQSSSLAWSNPVAWWWGMLTVVSGANIAVWFLLYRQLQPTGSFGSMSGIELMLLRTGSLYNSTNIELMLLLCAAYVFGCAFRSFLPRADVQRICLFDTWLLTTHYLGNAIENSIWAVAFFVVGIGLCRLLPEFDGLVRVVLASAIVGIAGYLAFLMTVDVPMYLSRWRAKVADGGKHLRPLEGLRDVSTRWIVTHDLAEWKDEIAWMSLYFSAAVWASLALCVCYSLEDHLPRYRTEATVASWSSDASAVASMQAPVMARVSAPGP